MTVHVRSFIRVLHVFNLKPAVTVVLSHGVLLLLIHCQWQQVQGSTEAIMIQPAPRPAPQSESAAGSSVATAAVKERSASQHAAAVAECLSPRLQPGSRSFARAFKSIQVPA
jgi:hypothetical protein